MMKSKVIIFAFFTQLLSQMVLAYNCKVDGIYYDLNGNEATVVKNDNYLYSGDIVIPVSITYKGKDYIVTCIGVDAFSDCRGLNSVIIGDSVKTIEWGSFRYSSISSIFIPKGVKEICEWAFQNCYYLSSLTTSSNVIKEYAFNACGLTTLVLSEGVETIGNNAFRNCGSLKSVSLPSSLKELNDDAFFGCRNLENITIDDGITCIHGKALQNTKWYNGQSDGLLYLNELCIGYKGSMPEDTHLIIKDGTKAISDRAFEFQEELCNITLPNSLVLIGKRAFSGCNHLEQMSIPDNVKTIGEDAFADCTELESINIPKELTILEPFIFLNCTTLERIIIPHGLKEISQNAFCGSSLKSITIPGSVKTIGDEAFWRCERLDSVIISEGVESIGSWAFVGCPSLSYITIPSTIKQMGRILFDYNNNINTVEINNDSLVSNTKLVECFGSQVKNYYLGEDVTSIGSLTFSSCALTSITISNSVSCIGEKAFYNCTYLTSISIPENVKEIDTSAFLGCTGLTSLTICNGLTKNERSAFSSCTSLTDVFINIINFSNKNMSYDIAPNVHYLIGGEEVTDLLIPDTVSIIPDNAFRNGKFLKTVTIPNTIEKIGDDAFNGCPALNDVYIKVLDYTHNNCCYGIASNVHYMLDGKEVSDWEIPDGVTSIGINAFRNGKALKYVTIPKTVTNIGSWAFLGCSNLSGINLPKDAHVSTSAFNGCSSLKKVTIHAPKVLAWFSGMSNLQEVILGDGVSTISVDAFKDCSNLSSINLPSGLTAVDANSFDGCAGLTSLVLPDSLLSIGDNAFKGCTGLTSISLPSKADIAVSAFKGCSELASVTINSTTVLPWFSKLTKLSEVIIGDDVIAIGDGAFKGCTALTSIQFPDSLVTIGANSFDGCKGLLSIVIPEKVTIGDLAFKECSGLSEIELPKDAHVSTSAFNGCSSLKKVTIHAPKVLAWFSSMSNLLEIVLGDSVSTIGVDAFNGCSNLSSINLPSGLTAVEANSFDGCVGLTSLVLPDSLLSIGENAFKGCTGLTSIALPSKADIAVSAFTGCNEVASVTINNQSVLPWFSGLGKLSEVKLGDEVTTIGEGAFKGCTALTGIQFPDSLSSIGANSFEGCTGLLDIAIPEKAAIGDLAFKECSGLSEIELPKDAHVSTSAFTGCSGIKKATIHTPAVLSWFAGMPNLQEVILDDCVSTISDAAFKDCSNVTAIDLPFNLTTIEANAFENCSGLQSIELPANVNVGDYSFKGCTGFTEITIPKGATVSASAFNDCTGLQSATIHTSKVLAWFAEMPNLKELNLDGGVTLISSGAFKGCSNLTSLDLSVNKIKIEANAFENCSGLQSVELPANVIVGDYSFKGCTGLKEITIPKGSTVSASAFNACTGLSSAVIHTSQVKTWFSEMTNMKEVELGTEVTSILAKAFNGCTSLKSIELPSNLTTIEEKAFYGCRGLTGIEIPAKLTSIGASAFGSCAGLTSLTIPENVQSLGTSAFAGCSALKAVEINSPKVLSKAGQISIIFGTQVTSYVVGDKATTIGDNVFGDTSRKSVTIPNDITTFGNTAFGINTTIKVARGSKSLLTLWNRGFVKPVDVETSQVLTPSKLTFTTSTQTTATFVVDNIYPEYTTTYDGTELRGSQIQLTGLRPEMSSSLGLKVALGNLSYSTSAEYNTKSLNLKISSSSGPTAFTSTGSYTEDDAEVIDQKMVFLERETDGNELFESGLEPEKNYTVKYLVTVGYGKNKTWDYSTQGSVTTQKLQLTTLAPKVIAKDEVIVAASSNIKNDEEKVGFEWRRTDAPDDVASRSGEAFLYEGTMEGYLHNLSSFNYWRFRPYYESSAGNKYYGSWATVEADDYSYFEPTVHTYAKIQVEGNTAEVKGYATRGSDGVTEQGFKYWTATNNVKAAVSSEDPRRAPSVPGNAKTIAATGQVMTAQLTGLDYKQKYCYVAYMKTDTGKIYYGEQQSFTTGEPSVGIGAKAKAPENGNAARYDLQGRKITKAVKGVNIIMHHDGSTRKEYVK